MLHLRLLIFVWITIVTIIKNYLLRLRDPLFPLSVDFGSLWLHSYFCSSPASMVRATEFTWSSLHSMKSCPSAFVLRLTCQAKESRGPMSSWMHSKLAPSVLLFYSPSSLYFSKSSNVSSGSIFSRCVCLREGLLAPSEIVSSVHTTDGLEKCPAIYLLGNGWKEQRRDKQTVKTSEREIHGCIFIPLILFT